MSGLFFGNRDVDVKIQGVVRFQFGFLNKSILITNEADIPIMKLNGASAKNELEKYLTKGTLTAPNLLKAVDTFTSQADNSGNPIVPEYLYVIGKAPTNVSKDAVDLITKAIEAETAFNDFYCLIPVFESTPFNNWLQKYLSANRRVALIYTATKNKVLADTEKSERIMGIYDGKVEFKNAAWAGRTISYSDLIAYKWKKLNGVSTDRLGDGDVSSLEDNGWNGYREIRGSGETTGSRTTANTNVSNSFLDTLVVRDNIIYNVAGALHDMFRQTEIIPMGDKGRKLVEQAIAKALNYVGAKGLIEKFEDGSYMYEINVPAITAAMRSMRELVDVSFKFVPTIPMESIEVKGQEILEWIEQ